MFNSKAVLLQKIKERYAKADKTKEDLLKELEWIIDDEKINCLVIRVLFRLYYRYDDNIKVEDILTDDESEFINKTWENRGKTTPMKRFKGRMKDIINLSKFFYHIDNYWLR